MMMSLGMTYPRRISILGQTFLSLSGTVVFRYGKSQPPGTRAIERHNQTILVIGFHYSIVCAYLRDS